MSGFCDFCKVWHSGSCCHPARPVLTEPYTAASAQVREVEALPDAAKYLATLQPIPGVASRDWQRGWDACCAYVKRKPAAEPVPVAQDIAALLAEWEGLSRWNMSDTVLGMEEDAILGAWLDYSDTSLLMCHVFQLLRQQQATIADHARREAQWKEVARKNRDGFEEYERRYYLEVNAREALEASLAACRADAERLDFYAEHHHLITRCGGQWFAVNKERDGVGQFDSLRAAIDAMRQEA